MPAKSGAQQKAAGAALAAKRGKTPKSKLKGASKSMAASMSEKQLDELASTKRKGKPERIGAKSKAKSTARRKAGRKPAARKSTARKTTAKSGAAKSRTASKTTRAAAKSRTKTRAKTPKSKSTSSRSSGSKKKGLISRVKGMFGS
ncbi:hypothetical protein IZ6_20420 [Terrihabitans soli]|uniref:DUF3008 family protein n=1 Tax=Terrihabitans soli TaxID=708113 RepID=A0A6S6QTN8_9HYPH|nr:hypothetical protein IZ6_20420 [Terrihabitans soli]